MKVEYIRDLATGKAALVSDEEEFKAAYPSGRYKYFEVEEADPAPVKKAKKAKKKDEFFSDE